MNLGDINVMSFVKLDIKRIERNEKEITPAFCFDDCVATLANKYGVDFRLLYINRLRVGFDLTNSEESLGKRIRFGYNLKDELKSFLGIEFEITNREKIALSELKKVLSNSEAVLISMDGYYCPWDWRYQTISGGTHMLFLVGIDENTGEYICVDPYYQKNNEKLSEELLEDGILSVWLTKHQETDEIKDVELFLSQYINSPYDESFAPLTELSNACRNEFEIDKEIEGYQQNEKLSFEHDQDRFTLNRIIKELVHDLVRFSVFLKYLASKTNKQEYISIADDFVVLSEKWSLVRFQILKRVFSGNVTGINEYIADRLDYAINEECKVINKLKNILNGLSDYNACEISNDGADNPIGISSYFNNFGVGSDNSSADFNGSGEYFLIDGFPFGKNVNSKFAYFKLIKNGIDSTDNISCSGQSIEINKKCKELHFLGCSDYDYCVDTLKIVYEDSSIEKKTLSFADWIPDYSKAPPAETVLTATKVTCYPDGSRDTDESGSLYYCIVHVDDGLITKRLVLPDNNNMHIFALTVKETF